MKIRKIHEDWKRELFQLSRYYTVPPLNFSSARWRVRLRRPLKLMLVQTRLGHFLRLPNSFKDSPSNEISFRLAKWKSRMNACLCIPSYSPKSSAFCPHLIQLYTYIYIYIYIHICIQNKYTTVYLHSITHILILRYIFGWMKCGQNKRRLLHQGRVQLRRDSTPKHVKRLAPPKSDNFSILFSIWKCIEFV